MDDCKDSILVEPKQLHLINSELVEPKQLHLKKTELEESESCVEEENKDEIKLEIIWRTVFLIAYLHVGALIGLYVLFFGQWMWKTFFWAFFISCLNIQGIGPGAHRLWCHCAYKAKLPLRIYLAFCNSTANQGDIYEWCRDHRVHHKFSETDADPHNARRGFFFAHVGWLMCRKHPDVLRKGKTVDMSDLLQDPVVVFQRKYYGLLIIICAFALPISVPYYLWGENFHIVFFGVCLLRYTFVLHGTWAVNSAAHLWGNRPYDKDINPSENLIVSFLTGGEGFHNFHHTFPWDYSASEWGSRLNLSTLSINLWAKLGQAYDLKNAPTNIVANRKSQRGDGTSSWDVSILAKVPKFIFK